MTFHFDSLSSRNKISSEIVAGKLDIVTNKVIEMLCVLQKQSFECGIHVLVSAKYIAYHYCIVESELPILDWYKGMKNVRVSRPDGNPVSQQTPTNPKVTDLQNSKWRFVPSRHSNMQKGFVKKDLFKNQHKINNNRFEVVNPINDGERILKDTSKTFQKTP